MARYSSREKARAVLRDAIISLCRETIPHKDEIAVEGLLGITVDQKDTWLVTIHEMIGGGQGKKRKLVDGSSMGITVKTVVGNSSMYFNSDSDEEKTTTPKRKYRSANYAAVAAKCTSVSNGSPKAVKSSSPQQVDVLDEAVDIKQEKPDSDSDEADDTSNWELCVDQVHASNDDALANEVLEMSGESGRNFSTIQTRQVQGRLSSKIRLHEFSEECGDHRPHLIPPTARRSHPQKRCRVCYKQGLRKESRYCCPVCPGYPGLCVMPCFELYHADKSYQSNANIGFGFNFQELDPMFDITHALGLRQKAHHMVVKQDSMGRRTVLSTAQTQALIDNKYVEPDDDLYLSTIDRQSIKAEMIDDQYEDVEMGSDTEGHDEDEHLRAQEEKEINEEIKMLVSDVESTGISASGRLTLQEVIEAQIEDDHQEETSCDDNQEEPQTQQTSTAMANTIEIVPEIDHEVETIEILMSSDDEAPKTATYLAESIKRRQKKSASASLTTNSLTYAPEIGSKATKTIEIVPTATIEAQKEVEIVPAISNDVKKEVEILPAASIDVKKEAEIVPAASIDFKNEVKIVPAANNESKPTSQHIHLTRSKTQNAVKIIPTSNSTLTDAVRALLARPQATQLQTSASAQSGVSGKAASPRRLTSVAAGPKGVATARSSAKSTFTVATHSTSTPHQPAVSAGATGPSASCVNVISLPSGALLSGAKASTTIRIPGVKSSTKTYMITKSASGIIKKTPIILKTVPMGTRLAGVPIAAVTMATTSTTSTTSTATPVKSVKKESRCTVPSGDDLDNYTIDLVPTPTSLNTQVLKVMVGKGSPDALQ